MDLTLTDILLLAILLFVILSFPLCRKFISLVDIFVKNYVKLSVEKKQDHFSPAKTLLNLKLLAYERMILFIERMKPDSLLPRTLSGSIHVKEYHQLLLSEVRKEYEYNMSQQLYMSDEAWNVITNLKNKVTSLINTVASECRPDQPAVELAQKVLEKYITSDIKVDEVLQFLKVDMERTIA